MDTKSSFSTPAVNQKNDLITADSILSDFTGSLDFSYMNCGDPLANRINQIVNTESLNVHSFLKSVAKERNVLCKKLGWIPQVKYDLKCDTCGVEFNELSKLLSHQKIHLNLHKNDSRPGCELKKKIVPLRSKSQTMFKCRLCNKIFVSCDALKDHLKRHLFRNLLILNNTKSRVLKLRCAQASNISKLKFNCKKCSKIFTDKKGLAEHMKVHSELKTASCKFCKKSFHCESYGKADQSGDVQSVCNSCKKRFIHSNTLKTYEQTQEGNNQYKLRKSATYLKQMVNSNGKFKCNRCSSMFSKENLLKIHLKTHNDLSKYQCDICGKRFVLEETYKQHVVNHTGKKPFVCSNCGKQFTKLSSLKNHLRVHSNEKPYACEKCLVKFTFKSQLKCHMKLHEKQTPFKCHICDTFYNTSKALNAHMKTHKKNRSFCCDKCRKTFIKFQNFKRHCHSKPKILQNKLSSNTLKNKSVKIDTSVKEINPVTCVENYQPAKDVNNDNVVNGKINNVNKYFNKYTDHQGDNDVVNNNVIIMFNRSIRTDETAVRTDCYNFMKSYNVINTVESCGFRRKEISKRYDDLQNRVSKGVFIHKTQSKGLNLNSVVVFRKVHSLTDSSLLTGNTVNRNEVKSVSEYKFDFNISNNDTNGNVNNEERNNVNGVTKKSCNELRDIKSNMLESVKKDTVDHYSKYSNMFICKDCGKGFKRKKNLLDHSRVHAGQQSCVCKECGKSFYTELSFKQHQIIHTKDKCDICQICYKTFDNSCSFLKHMRTHKNNERVVGDQLKSSNCDKTFKNSSNLRSQALRHSRLKHFACTLRPSSCSKLNSLKRNSHVGIHQFKCDICDKRFNSPIRLNSHKKSHIKTSFNCAICNKMYSRPGSLKYHMMIHSNGNVFKCKTCYKMFSTLGLLKQHQSIHSKEKQFVCLKCHKRFRESYVLKSHKRLHKRNKTIFTCNKCSIIKHGLKKTLVKK